MFGNQWFKKENPLLGLMGAGGGVGGRLTAGAAGPSALASGGLITEPGNGYVYHAFDGACDIYSSPGADDTTFANFSLQWAGFSDRGINGADDTAGSWCIVMENRAQESVSVRSQNTNGGPANGTYSFWYSTDNGTTFSPHPTTASGTLTGATVTTIGPHPSPYGGVTHVIYSDGTPASNRNYWAPTPAQTFVPESPTAITCDILAIGGGGAGGSSGGGAGGLVYWGSKPLAGTATLSIGAGGVNGPGGADPGKDGGATTITGPDFPSTLTCWGGGSGGGFNSPPYPSFDGGSGGGGYSSAGGSNSGSGGNGDQPPANGPLQPLPGFTQYGTPGSAGNTKVGYIYGGSGGGAGSAGEDFPGPTAPDGTYNGADYAEGGAGLARPGFEYPLWMKSGRTLGPEPNDPTTPGWQTNEFAGGGGAGSAPGNKGGVGGGGWGGNSYPMSSGEPLLGGGAGGNGSGRGAGGCGGVIIRYAV